MYVCAADLRLRCEGRIWALGFIFIFLFSLEKTGGSGGGGDDR